MSHIIFILETKHDSQKDTPADCFFFFFTTSSFVPKTQSRKQRTGMEFVVSGILGAMDQHGPMAHYHCINHCCIRLLIVTAATTQSVCSFHAVYVPHLCCGASSQRHPAKVISEWAYTWATGLQNADGNQEQLCVLLMCMYPRKFSTNRIRSVGLDCVKITTIVFPTFFFCFRDVGNCIARDLNSGKLGPQYPGLQYQLSWNFHVSQHILAPSDECH